MPGERLRQRFCLPHDSERQGVTPRRPRLLVPILSCFLLEVALPAVAAEGAMGFRRRHGLSPRRRVPCRVLRPHAGRSHTSPASYLGKEAELNASERGQVVGGNRTQRWEDGYGQHNE